MNIFSVMQALFLREFSDEDRIAIGIALDAAVLFGACKGKSAIGAGDLSDDTMEIMFNEKIKKLVPEGNRKILYGDDNGNAN